MKPWEETWTAIDPDDDGDDCCVARPYVQDPQVRDYVVLCDLKLAEAKLIAAAPEMARLLLWSQSKDYDSRDLPRRVFEVLTKAGVLPKEEA